MTKDNETDLAFSPSAMEVVGRSRTLERPGFGLLPAELLYLFVDLDLGCIEVGEVRQARSLRLMSVNRFWFTTLAGRLRSRPSLCNIRQLTEYVQMMEKVPSEPPATYFLQATHEGNVDAQRLESLIKKVPRISLDLEWNRRDKIAQSLVEVFGALNHLTWIFLRVLILEACTCRSPDESIYNIFPFPKSTLIALELSTATLGAVQLHWFLEPSRSSLQKLDFGGGVKALSISPAELADVLGPYCSGLEWLGLGPFTFADGGHEDDYFAKPVLERILENKEARFIPPRHIYCREISFTSQLLELLSRHSKALPLASCRIFFLAQETVAAQQDIIRRHVLTPQDLTSWI